MSGSKKRHWQKLLKKRQKFYDRHKLALPENVTAVQAAVERAILKHGHRVYRNDRDRCARFLQKLFIKYALAGKTTAEFWRLSLLCRLIGPAPEPPKSIKQSPEKSRPKAKKRKRKRR